MIKTGSFTRREFLHSSALATASAYTGPAVLAGQALSHVEKPSNSQRLVKDWEHYRGSLGGPWEVFFGGKAGDQVRWQKVDLPHCFNARDAVDPDQTYYRGQGWYRTNLKIQNPFAGGRTLLHFEGAGQQAEVFIALEKVGQHVGGYDEWTVDITDAKAIADPENKGSVPLAIVCDNSRDLERIPSDLSDFNLYGGLYRYVNLVYLPAISLERVRVTPLLKSDGSAEVSLRAELYNPTSSAEASTISIRVLDPDGAIVHTSSHPFHASAETDLAKFTLATPHTWSPVRPALYRCEATLISPHGEMTVSEPFGVRRYEFVEHGPFKLNGERLLIRGTQRHEDHAGVAAAMTEEMIRKEMQMVKEMGANFIRLGHYQQSRIVLNLCDQLGIMVWEEIPWCRSGIGDERWQSQVHRSLRNLIDQHYNHPSVVIWGLGNENDWPGEFPSEDHEAIRTFLTEIRDQAHTLDPTRLTGIRRCEFAKDIPDVYSPSIWAGWYRGRYTEYKSSVEQQAAQVKRLLHVEWGGDSHAGRHSEDPDKVISQITTGKGTDERGLDYLRSGGITRASSDGDWSESYICNLFDWHLKEQDTMPSLTGAVQWIFKDFSTPVRPDNPVPKVNQKGVLERDFTPKEGYYVFQSYWADKPMIHIYGHSWPVRWGDADEQKTVKVYSNCDTVELFLNGQSQGVKKRNSQDFPAAGLRWLVKLNPENQLRAVGRKQATSVEDQISFRYETRKWGTPAHLQLAEIGRSGEVVTIEARLLDRAGLLCLDARNAVRFGLAGGGTLIDDLGTNRGARVVELANGRALISLRRNGGKSQASVLSKDLPSAFLEVG